MQTYKDKLGKASITVEQGYWNINKDYDKLTVVEKEGIFGTFLSRKPVPAGTPLTNRTYWIPFSSLKEEIVIAYQEWVNKYGGIIESETAILNGIQQVMNDVYKHLPQGIYVEGNIDCIEQGLEDDLILNFGTTNNKNGDFSFYINDILYGTYKNIKDKELTLNIHEDTVVRIECTQNGYTFIGSWNVACLYPSYIGYGLTYEDILENDDLKIDTKIDITGFYSVIANVEDGFIFICVPKDKLVSNILMNGYNIPMEEPVIVRNSENIEYKIYKSINSYELKDYIIYIGDYVDNTKTKLDEVLTRLDQIDGLEGNGEDINTNNRNELQFADRAYNLQNPDGMGYVILRKDKTFAEQIANKPNTIFEIRYDFDLGDEEIIIPEGCVLKFDGGCINNGMLSGTNTAIEAGLIKIFGVELILNGSFKDDLHIEWFDIKNDLINAAQNTAVLKQQILPSCENTKNKLCSGDKSVIYFNEPIVFNGTYDLGIEGVLIYDGPIESTAITIGNDSTPANFGRNFFIHNVEQTSSDWYNDGNIIDNVGIRVKHIRTSILRFDIVRYFATCIKLTASLTGCASNKLYYDLIGGTHYKALVLEAKGSLGFVNENQINGKIIANYSTNPAMNICTAITIDSENEPGVNGNFIFNPVIEDNYIGIYFGRYNYGNVVFGARLENTTIPMKCYTEDNPSNRRIIPHNNVIYYHILNTTAEIKDIGTNRIIQIGEEIPQLKLIKTFFTKDSNTSTLNQCGLKKDNNVWGITVRNAIITGNFYKVIDTTKVGNILIEYNQPGRVCFAFCNETYELITNFSDTPINSKWIYSDDGVFKNTVTVSRTTATITPGYGYIFIGFLRNSNTIGFESARIYSDNLVLNDFCSVTDKEVSIYKPFKFSNAMGLGNFSGLTISADIDLNELTINSPTQILNINNHADIKNGSIAISCLIVPNYSELRGTGLIRTGFPKAGTLYGDNSKAISDGTKWIEFDGASMGVRRYGATSQRPAFAEIYDGFKYYDTTLNMEIINDNGTWVDSNGRTPGKHSGELADMPNFISGTAGANDDGYMFTFTDDATYGNKIVWWNTNAGGWVDATGTIVIPIQ